MNNTEEKIKSWILPTIGFCLFVVLMVFALLNAYGKLSFLNQNSLQKSSPDTTQQQVTDIKDFQKAINSLK